ncbi:MAG: polysaccharide deacetylase family protein, partial [Ignavibacteriaceae bacterium]
MGILFISAIIIACSFFPINFTNAQNQAKLSIKYSSEGLTVIANSEFHKSYGLAFPVTYMLDVPKDIDGLSVFERHSFSESWEKMVEKTPLDTFNDIEEVRFDYSNQIAYVSAAFEGISDSIYLKVVDKDNNKIAASYKGICKYYDNRRAAVTITFDDFADWTSSMIPPVVNIFREHGLYLTAGIITAGLGNETWAEIQSQLDEGRFEVASHSRSHSHTPYNDPVREIAGSVSDITNNLNLPELFNANGKEYVYVWIAPYGDYDAATDSLLGTTGYLVARLYKNLPLADPREYVYGDSSFSSWEGSRNHFKPFFPTVELGAPSWGGGDTSLTSLNNLFDS